MGPVFNATGRQVDKKDQKGAKFKNAFLFSKTTNCKVINIIRY